MTGSDLSHFFLGGVLIFSIVYSILGSGFGSPLILLAVFAVYGVFSAVDEGMTKAWLTLHIPKEYKATGLGLHLTLSSLGFMLASFITGIIWQYGGATKAFSVISIMGIVVIGYFLLFVNEDNVLKRKK